MLCDGLQNWSENLFRRRIIESQRETKAKKSELR